MDDAVRRAMWTAAAAEGLQGRTLVGVVVFLVKQGAKVPSAKLTAAIDKLEGVTDHSAYFEPRLRARVVKAEIILLRRASITVANLIIPSTIWTSTNWTTTIKKMKKLRNPSRSFLVPANAAPQRSSSTVLKVDYLFIYLIGVPA